MYDSSEFLFSTLLFLWVFYQWGIYVLYNVGTGIYAELQCQHGNYGLEGVAVTERWKLDVQVTT
jgi:hypothetical protein